MVPSSMTIDVRQTDIIALLDTSQLEEYNRLCTLYRSVPTTLFVNQLLVDYHSNEEDLERVRSFLFDTLKECEHFPFSLDCDLKRRVHTRSGDSVPVKLSKDIYHLLSVLEGEDYSEINDIVSRAKSKGRSKSVSVPIIGEGSEVSSKSESGEVKILRDKIVSLEADILLTKQRQAAVESLRAGEIKELRQGLIDCKTQIQQLSTTVKDEFRTLNECVLSVLCRNNNDSDSASDTSIHLSKLSETITALQGQMMALCKFVRFSQNVNETTPFPIHNHDTQQQSCTMPSAIPEVDDVVSTDNTPSVLVNSIGQASDPMNNDLSPHPITCVHASTIVSQNMSNNTRNSSSFTGNPSNIQTVNDVPLVVTVDMEDDCVFGGAPIPTRISDRSQQNNNVESLKRDDRRSRVKNRSYRDVLVSDKPVTQRENISFEKIYREIGKPKSSKHNVHTGSNIPVQVTEGQGSTNVADDNYDEAEFLMHVKKRKRTKRFYVGGFMPSISENFIKSYVSRRGFTPSKVTIFRNYRRDTATIRLNVLACQELDELTSANFWPHGIICRPWLTRNQLKRDRWYDQNQDYDNGYCENDRYSETAYNESYCNRYSYLPCEID